MKRVIIAVCLLSAPHLAGCSKKKAPSGAGSASAQAAGSEKGSAQVRTVVAAPRIGGSVASVGDFTVEVALHRSGFVDALVLDQTSKVVSDAKLEVTARGKGETAEKIGLGFAAPLGAFQGRATGGAELTSGPVEIALQVGGKAFTGKLEMAVALPEPELGGHVLAAGDVGVEVLARANGDVDAKLWDAAGAEIKGDLECKARLAAVTGGIAEIKLAFDPGRACWHGRAEGQLAPGPLEVRLSADGKVKLGNLDSASLVASAAHGGKVVAVGAYSVELVAKGPEIAAFVFDASGKAHVAGDLRVVLDAGALGDTRVNLKWDAPRLSYAGRAAANVDLSVQPIQVTLLASGKAFVGSVASIKAPKLDAKAGVDAKIKAPQVNAAAAAEAKVTPPKVDVNVKKSASASAGTGAKAGGGAKASAGFSFGTK